VAWLKVDFEASANAPMRLSTIDPTMFPNAPTGTLSSGHHPPILDAGIPAAILTQPLVAEPGHTTGLSEILFHNMPNPGTPVISPPSPEHTEPAAIGDNSSTSRTQNLSQPDINALFERMDRLEELIRQTHSASPSTVERLPSSPSPGRADSLRSGPSRRPRWRSGSGGSTPLTPELTTVTSHELLKPPISKTTVNDRTKFTAISTNGQNLALLTDETFRIFDTTQSPISLACMGRFVSKGTDFQYLHPSREMESQVPLPDEQFEIGKFSCVAISNEYLAIGCKGRMMIFIIEGEHAGRWVCDAIHDSTTFMEKLEFSADGRTLLALLRSQSSSPVLGSQSIEALIYSTENIQKEDIIRQSPVTPTPEVAPALKWNWDFATPTGIAFSGNGMTVAVSTAANAQGAAKISLLQKVGSEWKYLQSQSVEVLGSVEKHGKGITGMALYFPKQPLANFLAFATTRTLRYRWTPLAHMHQTAIPLLFPKTKRPSNSSHQIKSHLERPKTLHLQFGRNMGLSYY